MEVKETFCSVNQILTNSLIFIWVEYFDSGLREKIYIMKQYNYETCVSCCAYFLDIYEHYICDWARGGAVGWGSALQAGRSRVQLPMISLEFFIDIILPGALLVLGSTQPLTEMSTRNISYG